MRRLVRRVALCQWCAFCSMQIVTGPRFISFRLSSALSLTAIAITRLCSLNTDGTQHAPRSLAITYLQQKGRASGCVTTSPSSGVRDNPDSYTTKHGPKAAGDTQSARVQMPLLMFADTDHFAAKFFSVFILLSTRHQFQSSRLGLC